MYIPTYVCNHIMYCGHNMYIPTHVCKHIMDCGHNMYIPTYIATLMIRYYLHILANKQLCMYVIVRLIV